MFWIIIQSYKIIGSGYQNYLRSDLRILKAFSKSGIPYPIVAFGFLELLAED